ncbi:hypothetical protein ACIQGZ_03905 [Streptomyces sp. NPDC092296]|uniref:hypothetical protein n=1 Tax=Streptomyces sp. NPDC092296 TaxID=3366012 RepID=UPI0037FCCD9D
MEAPTHQALQFHAGPARGDATRYLCAAARLDRHFRNAVISELVEHSYRVPAPSPGTDLVRVLHECLRARRDEVWAGLAMLLVLLIGFFTVDSVATLFVLATVLLLRLFRARGGSPRAAGVALADGRTDAVVALTAGPGRRGGWRAVLAVLATVVLARWLLLWGYGVSEVFGRRYDSGYESGYGFSLPVYLGMLAVLWLIAAALGYRVRTVLAGRAGPDARVGTDSPILKRIYGTLGLQQSGPELLYSDHAPLIGLGVPQDYLQVNMELIASAARRAEEREPEPVDAALLYQAISTAVRALGGGPDYPWDALHGLTVTDRVFRPGTRPGETGDWLGRMSGPSADGIPVLTRPWADALALSGHERLRHCLAVRIGSWQEEVVATVLVRVTTQGGMLHLELSPYVLPPVSEAYHLVDRLGDPDLLSDGAVALGLAGRRLGVEVTGAIAQVGTAFSSVRRAARIRRRYRQVAGRYAVDRSPRISVRELAAAQGYQNVFQKNDVDRFFGTVSQRVFSAVLGELEGRGYSTAAFRSQTEYIINNINHGGVQVTGGTVHGHVAGGAQARVNLSTPPPRVGSGG